jgi:5-methylcytosine-specific restriction endonuclease McrBC regulatory subunit McrC
MQITREQRKSFVKNARKQVKKGLMTNAEFQEIKKQMAELGKEQHENLQQQLKENNGVSSISNQNTHSVDIEDEIDIDAELAEEDFTPDDL